MDIDLPLLDSNFYFLFDQKYAIIHSYTFCILQISENLRILIFGRLRGQQQSSLFYVEFAFRLSRWTSIGQSPWKCYLVAGHRPPAK